MSSNKKPVPIDVDKIDLDKLKEKTTDIPSLIEYAHSIGSFSIVPTEQGAIKGRALKAMEQQTGKQMEQIYEQMKLLAEQAKTIQDRTSISLDIYDAAVGFEPLIGETYYLYEKNSGEKLLSLVSPDEWGEKLPFKSYIATVALLADHTWDIIEKNAIDS